MEPVLPPPPPVRRLVPAAWIAGASARAVIAGEWLAQRTLREQVFLAAGGFAVAAALFFALVWMPLAAAREAALARLSVLDRALAQARNVDPAAPVAAQDPAATVVTSTAAAYGLAIRRLESEGPQTRVSLDDVRFETLLAWLDDMERSAGLRATGVELERRPEPGVVTARLVLER